MNTPRTDIREFLLEEARNGGIPSYSAIGDQFGISRQRAHQIVSRTEELLGMSLRRSFDEDKYKTVVRNYSCRSRQHIERYTRRRQMLLAQFSVMQSIIEACKNAKVPKGSCGGEVDLLEEHSLLVCQRPNARRRICYAPDPSALVPMRLASRTVITKERVEYSKTKDHRHRMSQGSKHWWASMDPEEKRQRIERMHAGRRNRRAA